MRKRDAADYDMNIQFLRLALLQGFFYLFFSLFVTILLEMKK